jgi:hypothetical protein
MRAAWNPHSYTKAGKHFGQALLKLYGGFFPEDESASMPMVTVDNMIPLSKIFQTFSKLVLPVASSKKQRAKPSLNFAIPDDKSILHNVKAQLTELLMDFAKFNKDILSKNYIAAGKLFGYMFALISEPITADHMVMEHLE